MIMIRRQEAHDGTSGPRFLPGELVRHRRYGYRGVVVEGDTQCQAPEGWYEANKTQPRRDQPWYHVLVDESASTTYAAEENLESDFSDAPITHPLLSYFFVSLEEGRYVRNERPWAS
jgi:heat shock protein HspQ